jgi:hypothetical protein
LKWSLEADCACAVIVAKIKESNRKFFMMINCLLKLKIPGGSSGINIKKKEGTFFM